MKAGRPTWCSTSSKASTSKTLQLTSKYQTELQIKKWI
ncbi:hypothetical protein SynBIOSE41_04360 [Synechococcus sp. BIOS-E4-1]|nr:hypothetical protein SynBIOSE41_04360 [Synechococcus sp. BIOS-E4-1]